MKVGDLVKNLKSKRGLSGIIVALGGGCGCLTKIENDRVDG